MSRKSQCAVSLFLDHYLESVTRDLCISFIGDRGKDLYLHGEALLAPPLKCWFLGELSNIDTCVEQLQETDHQRLPCPQSLA